VPAIKSASKRYVKEDIIDKVLLRDLPSLYGINDIQEMNRLFTVLAYNTGNAVSPEELSQSSGVPKHLLQKYLDYLEAAFLIVRVAKINESGKHFKRQRQFKVYLTNPSMRAALFKPVKGDDPAMGATTKTMAGEREVQGITIRFFPCSLHCYQIGRRVTLNR